VLESGIAPSLAGPPQDVRVADATRVGASRSLDNGENQRSVGENFTQEALRSPTRDFPRVGDTRLLLSTKKLCDAGVPPPAALSLLATVVRLWLLIVQVRILRAAFEWHWIAALLFFFALNVATALIYGSLFGVPPSAT
jgi:hypothetical protein